MKNKKLSLLAIAVITAGLFAFKPFFGGTVKGTVAPPEAGVRAWVLSATDTLKANVSQGVFESADVKPGLSKLIIEAKPPCKNTSKDGIQVTDGGTVDVGEIKLSQ